jgi:phage-related tail fiber protein
MAQYYTLLTQVGQAKLANAVALGNTIELTHLAVGDGGGSVPTPDSDRTSLINEVRRAPINRVEVDADNPNWVVVEQVMPPDVGGWTIREIGVFDSAGDLIAYGNYPETYKPTLDEGSGRTQTVRMVLQVSDTAAVTLKVDPSVVLATRGYADTIGEQAAQALQAHEESRAHPAATTSDQGMVQLATSQETREGTRTDRAAHPAGIKSAIDQAMDGQLDLANQRLIIVDGVLAMEEI